MVVDQVITAASAFSATNVDDFVILMLFLSRTDRGPSTKQVVVGQVVGLGLLVALSLLGFFGRVLVPEACLGLLGLLPISLGVSRLIEWLEDPEPEPDPGQVACHPLAGTLSVAAVTIANGSDNVGVYMPLFAHTSRFGLLVTLAVFALGVALWCWLAWRLARTQGVTETLTRFGGPLIPLVLIGLGALILVDSHTLDHRGQAVIALTCLVVLALSLARQLQPLLEEGRPLLSRPLSAVSPLGHRDPLRP
jgi:cadmium resistance transport/sequestration family protein